MRRAEVFEWDVNRNCILRRFRSHTQRINSVAYNFPDCSLLLSGSYDRTVCVWDLKFALLLFHSSSLDP